MGVTPRIVQVKAIKNQAVIADKCVVAESFRVRLKGLIGKAKLEEGQAMLFPECNNIHMWFMSIPIDVVFLRKTPGGNLSVSSMHANARPWRLLPILDSRADGTLELPAGAIERSGLKEGDELCIS